MTTPRPQKKRFKVEPDNGGQLQQLLIEHAKAKDEAEAAGEREDDLKAAIKAWLLSLYPDGQGLPDAFDIAADPHGRHPAYTMTLKGGMRFDSKLYKELNGDYEEYMVPVTPSWDFRRTQAEGRR